MMDGETTGRCQECGASRVDGLSCWEQLGMIISWEGDDEELRALHFLTVASYNLQHPAQFTAEALRWLRAGFIEHIDLGTAVTELRRQAAAAYEGRKRVLRPQSERVYAAQSWSMTIAGVYAEGRREGAAQRVRAWAEAIRTEL